MSNEQESVEKKQLLHRAEGVTPAECYLKGLCEKSFLTLWSYASVYRDEGKTGIASHGKEVCDLLVVFENHIIIFSDKDCKFPDTGDLQLDWSRWFRKAISKSANQVWGAEDWIKKHSDRLFVDRACTQQFPIKLPEPSKAIYHRIVVAHDSSARCRKELQGSGSLTIVPDTVADGSGTPFVVGQIDPSKGFFHIFDDTSLDIVMGKLDTITDFVTYLAKKERFLISGQFGKSAGEEELLTRYLLTMDEKGEHSFTKSNSGKVFLEAGLWNRFLGSSQRKAQEKADKISYGWDALIETFSKNMLGNTLYYTSHPEFAALEKSIRFLAREPRLRRRMLAAAFFDLIQETPKERRQARVLAPSFPGDPYFIFLVFPMRDDRPDDEYRIVRGNCLITYCKALKAVMPDAQYIVGIATEPGLSSGRSEDAIYFDATSWTEDDQKDAEAVRKEFGLFQEIRVARGTEWEYLIDKASSRSADEVVLHGQNLRNKPCPCGSGRKYKHCHGK